MARDNFGDLGLEGKIILKWVLENWSENMNGWTGKARYSQA
jgi:hypothetical protein